MKKIMFVVVMMLVAIMAVSVASAAPAVSIERLDGQFIFVGDTNEVVSYMMEMDRQSLLDMAIIDRGEGAFYARILDEDEILTWSNGTEISAFDLTANADSYRVLQNSVFIVEDVNGQVTPDYSVETRDIQALQTDYVAVAYSEEHEALVEGSTVAESYPLAQPWDELIIRSADDQEIFKALVVGYRYEKKYDDFVYFIAWRFWSEPGMQVLAPEKPAPRSTLRPTRAPGATPTPKPTPENNPRPTEGMEIPENNPRPTEPTGHGEVVQPGEVETDPLPVTPPPVQDPENNRPSEEDHGENHRPTQEEIDRGRLDNGEAVGHGQVSTDPDPMTDGGSSCTEPENNPVRPTEEEVQRGRLDNGEAVGHGQVSHDTDPFTSGGSCPQGGNSGRPSESGSSSSTGSSSSGGGESTGSGTVANSDEDPFA